MDTILLALLVLAVLVLLVFVLLRPREKETTLYETPVLHRLFLAEQVPFYRQLSDDKQKEFEQRVQHFLSTVKITGVKTEVEDLDRVLIAASAVIPIFHFPGWEYMNLREVLLYPDSFSHEFKIQGQGRHILGMVGDGPLNQVMLLSRHELRQAFMNTTGKTNTAIHEFIHLVDKTDGAIDGIPEAILQQQYIVPWLQLMRKKIQEIMENRSDINPYGAGNDAEFFAVVSEYFFERPDLLKEKHPELYDALSRIFNTHTNRPAQ